MRWELLYSLFLILVAAFVTSFILYQLIPGEEQIFLDINNTNNSEGNYVLNYSGENLFYPNIRFASKRISYFIDDNCNGSKLEDVHKAFDILTNETILEFKESSYGDIKVSCSDKEDIPKEGFFVAGEGGPNSITNASSFYIINNGTILLYRENKCNQPIVPLHEILHVLGFKHSLNKKSIMYEISDCNQQITPEIKEIINNLYNYPQLPDLIIKNANAFKTGRQLNFQVEIFNSGLDFSSSSVIGIFADGNLITEYEVGQLETGSGKIIQVSNLRVPREFKELLFVIDSHEDLFEINEDNNEKLLVIN